MFTLLGPTHPAHCDGVSRRDFLRVGSLTMGGLCLPQLLACEAAAAPAARKPHKSVIMIFLAGGPPHQDMVDLKPDAPREIRGEFEPIETVVPGLLLCEHMPQLAQRADKLAIIRSIVGCRDEHTAYQMLTGYTETPFKRQGRPALGSIVSYLQGPVDPAIPPFVGLSPKTREPRWGDPGFPGYLGLAHAPFTPNRGETVDPARTGIPVPRYLARKSLLQQMDQLRRRLDDDSNLVGMDAFNRAAFEILTSPKLIDALDVSREDPRIRARYGIGNMKPEADGPPCCMDHFLIARRLVEAGARCVTISFGRWDTHGNNFKENARRIPKLDMALSALLDDLEARGLSDDVAIVVWGEFGRTPKVNKQAGRDHWPRVSMAILAGGGFRTGQVIGATDKDAAYAKDRPVHVQEVFATLYHHLGIGPDAHVPDQTGRPMYLLDRFEPIRELIG
ncbi:MAG: hypothetical protein KatS3mg108_1973 [Isosphaeraceae bacterium]|jgi:hypothetical protein|nr:MAG: hypothetical protein KatS3mg108_1973 [Isosphaeraceae bacterium]